MLYTCTLSLNLENLSIQNPNTNENLHSALGTGKYYAVFIKSLSGKNQQLKLENSSNVCSPDNIKFSKNTGKNSRTPGGW